MRISDWSSDVCSSDLRTRSGGFRVTACAGREATDEAGRSGQGGRETGPFLLPCRRVIVSAASLSPVVRGPRSFPGSGDLLAFEAVDLVERILHAPEYRAGALVVEVVPDLPAYRRGRPVAQPQRRPQPPHPDCQAAQDLRRRMHPHIDATPPPEPDNTP